jgi:hypothetical protein
MVAVVAIAMLLVEVWQSSRVAELSLNVDQTRAALDETQAYVEHLRVDGERRLTRAELDPIAGRLGLAPARPDQVVALPLAYLAEAPSNDGTATATWDRAWPEGIMRALVPEATARSRAR